MTFKIGDNEIETKVMEKQKAKELYEDKVASGHTATYASLKDEDEVKILSIFLGAF